LPDLVILLFYYLNSSGKNIDLRYIYSSLLKNRYKQLEKLNKYQIPNKQSLNNKKFILCFCVSSCVFSFSLSHLLSYLLYSSHMRSSMCFFHFFSSPHPSGILTGMVIVFRFFGLGVSGFTSRT